jgi:hypothetical protein
MHTSPAAPRYTEELPHSATTLGESRLSVFVTAMSSGAATSTWSWSLAVTVKLSHASPIAAWSAA